MENQKIQFTLDLNQLKYFVDNSVEGDVIIVRLHLDPDVNYTVNCREKTKQSPHVLENKFKKYKSLVDIAITNSVITLKYSNVADAVDCLRDMMNDQENPSFGMPERLLGSLKMEFLKDLTKYNKMHEFNKGLSGKKIGKEETNSTIKNTTPNKHVNKPKQLENGQKKLDNKKNNRGKNVNKGGNKTIVEETPLKKFSRIKRDWISPEVLNAIVETLDSNENGLEALLAQFKEIKIEPPAIPPLMHSVDVYMDSRIEKLPLYDVLITGFPNHLSYKDIRCIALTCTDISSFENVNVMEEIIQGVEHRFCIVYLTSSESADFLAKGLNKAIVKGKRLSAVTFSNLDAQWKKLHNKI